MERSADTRIVHTSGCHDCGGRCVFRVHVRDGAITRVETDQGPEPQIRACARGRAYRHRLHAPDRLKYPMKRVGARGEGKFQRISWDEALDTVADAIKHVKADDAMESILALGFSGAIGQLHGGLGAPIVRLLNMYGGCTTTWGGASGEGATFACRATYGSLDTAHSQDDLLNSRLIILWGWDPASSIFKTNTSFYLAQAKEKGIRIVSVDPRCTDTTATFASQWLPIRPGTDAAVLIAMAYVIIGEGLVDKAFLDKYTIGFEKFKDYVTGAEDGVPKTTAWAEVISGVPASDIAKLGRLYGTEKPAALMAGFAPGRTAYGEQFHRAAMTLAAVTGNIGVHGGNPTGYGYGPIGFQAGPGLPVPKNPKEKGLSSVRGSLDVSLRSRTRVNICDLWDAILCGKAGGYPANFRMLYVIAANPLNQFLNTNKGVAALNSLEFIVVHEQFMTATARYADILLPANTNWERSDIFRPWLSGPYYLYSNKAVASLHESKSDLEICTKLARKLGIEGYNEKTEEEWLRYIFQTSGDLVRDIPDFEAFKKAGVHRIKTAGPLVAFEKEIGDIEHQPFATPSGKIELFSQRLADMEDPHLPPVAKYVESWEGPGGNSVWKKYPLQLVTIHFKTRAHSCFDNVGLLKELEPQTVWINSTDARSRNIANGDWVRVFNERGRVAIQARVTERIMPGVVSIGEGAWYRPDGNGVDQGGCPNVLLQDRRSPGGAFPSNSCLVQIEKS